MKSPSMGRHPQSEVDTPRTPTAIVNKALIFRVILWGSDRNSKNRTELDTFKSSIPEGDYEMLAPFLLFFASWLVILPVLLQWMSN